MKDKILNILKTSGDNYVSGQIISDHLGVSRAAIWKYINKLKEEGYEIESISKNGYKLISSPDIVTFHEVHEFLNTKYIGQNIIHFDTIDSTNTKAKELAAQGEVDGTLIISEEQSLGRGRLGRQWCSPKYKGIWMSLILKPDIDPLNASNITLIAAAAVHEAFKSFNINTQIKWPNDIILNNKKLCGILTEMSSELNQINYLVLGIGVNVNTSHEEFPEELKNIATSILVETKEIFSRKKLIAAILNYFEDFYEQFLKNKNLSFIIDICKKNSILLGKEIQLYNRGTLITAKAVDIDEAGLLVIEHKDGTLEKIISGEVSMHGLSNFNK